MSTPTGKAPRLARFVVPAHTDAQAAKQLLSTLKQDIAELRRLHWPPTDHGDGLYPVRDLPVYRGSADDVRRYQQHWQDALQRAQVFFPEAGVSPDAPPLPSTLGLPQFIGHVQRLHLTRTSAKESKSFGSVGALVDRCGAFEPAQQAALRDWLDRHPEGRLVAHRPFIDLRAYVFRVHPETGAPLLPERVRFYRTGLVMAVLEGFEVMDSRSKPRKQRNDSYQNPLAQNSTWTVYGRDQAHFEAEPEGDAEMDAE